MDTETLRTRYRHLIWSNPSADEAILIRQALLTGKAGVIADFVHVFGVARVTEEWAALQKAEDPPIHPVIRREVNHFLKLSKVPHDDQ